MSLLTDKEIREALKPVGITPGNVLYEASRAIEQAVMTKLLEQNEPFAWACWSDGDTEQKPIDCYLSTDEPTAYPIRKKLFTHPAPIAPKSPFTAGEDNDGWYVEFEGDQIAYGLTEEKANHIVSNYNAPSAPEVVVNVLAIIEKAVEVYGWWSETLERTTYEHQEGCETFRRELKQMLAAARSE